MIRKFALAVAMVSAFAVGLNADVITQWTFEGDVLTPATGAGTASYIGGTAAAGAGEFATGNGGGRGWNTSSYAAQSQENGLRGVEFLAGTAGYSDIVLEFDHRASGTGSRWAQVSYTLDGGANWTPYWNNGGGLSPHDTFYSFSVDFSSVIGANNNPNFGVRVLSIFSPNAFDENATNSFGANTAYQRANAQSGPPGTGIGTGTYTAAGTWRFDNVTFNGTAIPEPSMFGVLALCGMIGLARRRSR
ncbi:MAG TPA: PEP-CTERM sorting domain-containing protein [Pirellulaceae bacterium]|nr:PEP-CTERM sorting domain-containing protein [Pirellulaceae bacterium]HMO93688.1 PEP-CTERM sorting domain-containing protein [Pirellulaceae bacterium]HMP68430.1 PEP-CTERM sorting domain-containing protein [Pirellulaceae bacterium]